MRDGDAKLRRSGWIGETGQGLGTRKLQAIGDAGLEVDRGSVEISGYFFSENVVGGGHSDIPLAFSIMAKACTAREQWVFTLPSEQPIAAAASATSSSSQ